MRTKWTVVPALAAVVLATSTPAAWAVAVDPNPNLRQDEVHLVVTLQGPVLSDDHAFVFRVQVTNLGPARATQLETRQSVLFCATPTDPLSACQNTVPVLRPMRSLDANGSNAYGAKVPVPVTDAITVRTTIEVSHVLQHDVSSDIGNCNYGLHPQDACVTDVTSLSK